MICMETLFGKNQHGVKLVFFCLRMITLVPFMCCAITNENIENCFGIKLVTSCVPNIRKAF